MKKGIQLFSILLVSGTILIGTIHAATSQPGSAGDPVVTKSYVDKKLAELSNSGIVSNNNTQLTNQIKIQQQMIDLLINEMNNMKGQKSSGSVFEVVVLQEGQALLGKQGTEIIVRSGNGNIMASAAGGIQDITTGSDLKEGEVVPMNHLIIVPKEDGRGIKATTSLIVMVRGGYSIQ